MALNTFGWTPAEVTTDSAGNAIAGAELTVWEDLERTTPIAFAYDRDGTTVLPTKTVYAKGDTSTALTSAVVTSGAKGRFGFIAQDTYSLVYVWDGSSDDPWPVAAHEALDSGSATHAQAVADAQAAADSAAASANLVGAPADTAIATAINGAGTQTKAALSATYETGTAKLVYVSPSGNDSRNGKTWGTAKLTVAGALSAMGTSRGTIVLDIGTIDAGAGIAWPATATCGMVGQGPGNTIIQATAQTGPVLDLTAVGYGLNDSEFGGFSLYGDNTAGTAKKGLALSSVTSLVRINVHDITVKNTGGAPFDLGYAELSDFDRLTAYEPVSVVANDVPYVKATGAFNGNRINGLQLYGVNTGANVGASGAVVIKDNGSTAPHDNHISTPRVEALHLPTGGTIFALAGNGQVISDIQVFDSTKDLAGSTGTSHVRLTDPSGTSLKAGGNLVRGVIPGKGTNTTDIDMGVDVQQSRNLIQGVKGYKGANVTVAAGVNNTTVILSGAVSAATDPAVVDNSGTTTNVFIDDYLMTTKQGARTFTQGAASFKMEAPGGAWAGGPRFIDAATPANGCMGVGTGGVRIQTTGTNALATADQWLFRKVDLTPAPIVLGQSLTTNVSIAVCTGTPEGAVTAPVGAIRLRTDGAAGTTLYVKESGTGNTGWVAK